MPAQACSGPQLRPWHTESLKAEFTAKRTDEVQTFDDYLQLEEDLFKELEEKVYAPTGTGGEYELVRYSSGSVMDPRSRQPDWNRSFEMPTDNPVGGVVLLHGLTDSPYSLRALAETLHQRNYWVLGLREFERRLGIASSQD